MYDPVDPWTTDPIKQFLLDTSRDELDCFEDCYPAEDDELAGLTIGKPHINAHGSLFGHNIRD